MVAHGTIKPFSSFNSREDAETLRKAMKGIGTDEKSISHVLATRSNAQRQQIKIDYTTLFGKHLEDELKSELSGHYEETALALLKKPDEFLAEQLHIAMKGAGTDENALIDVICTQNNAQIIAIKAAYKLLYKSDLEADIKSETSGNFQRLLVSLLQGGRKEDEHANSHDAAADAAAIYEAGEGQLGTDESRFNAVLASRSYEQLNLIFHEYSKISNKTILQAIESEFSGDVKNGLLAIVKSVQNRFAYFAERLHSAMKGLGTNDRTLIRILVSRSEIDLANIKETFQAMYGKTLYEFIADDCSGDYKELLLLICGH